MTPTKIKMRTMNRIHPTTTTTMTQMGRSFGDSDFVFDASCVGVVADEEPEEWRTMEQ